VTVSSAAGPFIVTQPNTNVNWNSGSQQTITWDVASTDAAPVNCASVRISLSTDGGLSFPTVLAASTANDGSELITLPDVSSNQCRIKVEAIGNIFFDISNANFTVNDGGPACPGQYDLGNNNKITKASAIPPDTDVYGTINTSTDKDFYSFVITNGGTVNITLNNLPADYDIALYNGSGTIIGQSRQAGTANETISTTLAAGNYAVRVKGKNGALDGVNCYDLKVGLGTASRLIAANKTDAVTPYSKAAAKIYPNPVSDVLYINMPAKGEKYLVKVYDVNGKTVVAQTSSGAVIQINVSRVNSGIYFIKIANMEGKEVYSSRFMKK
jgi:hypothetical protein